MLFLFVCFLSMSAQRKALPNNTEGMETKIMIPTINESNTWRTPQIPATNEISTFDITAGNLAKTLNLYQLNTITNLKLNGTINARDFKIMRDSMPVLSSIDLSGATVTEYTGTLGTFYDATVTTYPANTIPQRAFYYTATKTGKTSLTSFIFPAAVNSTGIYAFRGCGLTAITIPSTVTSIGYGTFYNCNSLTAIIIPPTTTLIGIWAFGYCTNLKNVTIPSSVNSIGDYTFYNCIRLNNITLPSSISLIGIGTFSQSGLKQITLNEGLTTIGDYAFQSCDSLQSIHIPSTVIKIGYCALTFDNALKSITAAGNNEKYASADGVLFDKTLKKLVCFPAGKTTHYNIPDGVTVIDTAAFEGNWTLQSITIPSTVTKLALEAFYWCTTLSKIELPASLNTIERYSFYNCNYLSGVFVNSTTPVSIEVSDSIFKYLNAGCILYVPERTKNTYQTANVWKDFRKIIEFEKVTDYEGNVYHGIKIGNQTWLAENLRTVRYQNGDLISTTDPKTKDTSNEPYSKYSWDCDGNVNNSYMYGRLYTWNSVTDSRSVCPSGWRIPTRQDWQTLEEYLTTDAGISTSITKSLAATSYWGTFNTTPNVPGNDMTNNNESGFMAFPAGVRQLYGSFNGLWGATYLWSSTLADNGLAYAYYFDYNGTELFDNSFTKNSGFSVRCVKDIAPGTYSNASLSGPWYHVYNGEHDIYLLFDGNGNINEMGGYYDHNGSNIGTYSVTSNGLATYNIIIDGKTFTRTGQFITPDSISAGSSTNYAVRIPNPEKLTGTWNGAITNSDYPNLSITIDNTGKITSPATWNGHIFTRMGKTVGFVDTHNGSNCWHQFTLVNCTFDGNNTITGTAYSECSDLQSEAITLTRNANTLYTYKEVTPKLYYIIGLGDGKWNITPEGLGASHYPLSLVDGNSYDYNGNGTFTYTGYFTTTGRFKLVGGNMDWNEQWGNSGAEGINNPMHNNLLSSNLLVPSNGYYTITLNTINNTLSIVPSTLTPTFYASIGLIGDMDGWSSDKMLTPTESANNHVWYTDYTFNTNPVTEGGVKFRANNSWGANWGNKSFPYGIGTQDGANIVYMKGKYKIFLNDIDGTYYFIKRTETGINEPGTEELTIYPNPVSDRFYLNSSEKNVQISIYDLRGNLSITKQISGNEYINVSTLSQGVYLLKVRTEKGLTTKKLIKK